MSYLLRLFPLLLLGCAAGLWLLRRRSTQCRLRFLVAIVIAIGLLAWPPTAWLAAGTLEWWYAAEALPEGQAEAIVVLSGYVKGPRRDRPRAELGSDSYGRVRHAAWLYRSWNPLPILACGGGVDDGNAVRAVVMKEYLETEGIPATDIWIEGRSSNTYENASFAASWLRSRGVRRVAVVTDGMHMLRAELAFRRQGFEVVPAPCCFKAARLPARLETLVPGHGAMATTERVFHEWLGLVWYKLRGRI